MILQTTSQVISFAKQLETDSAALYSRLCQEVPSLAELLRCYSKANEKNARKIEQAYYAAISDALDASFSFNIDTERYVLEDDLPNAKRKANVVQFARGIEQTIICFYLDAASQSESLMADVSRAFALAAKKRKARLSELEGLG